MAKDKKPILFDEIKWGNQETGSLSHEDILDVNWNNKWTKEQKESFRKSSLEFWNNLDKQERKDFLSKRKKSSEAYWEKYYNNPALQEDRKLLMQELAKDPKWIEANLKGADKRKEMYFADEEWFNDWHKKHLASQNKKRIYISTPDGIIQGYEETCRHYNITVGSLRDRMFYNPTQYFYCDKQGKKIESSRKIQDTTNYKKAAKVRRKAVMTPAGQFDSLADACKHHNLTGSTIREKLKSTKEIHLDWYYIEEKNNND